MKSILKKILVRCIALLIGLTVALGAGELIIRLMYKSKMTLYPRYHSCVKYGEFNTRRIRPNTEFTHTSADGSFQFKTNNKGFRDNYDVEYDNPGNFFRVITIGDSHTQGYEVNQEQSYSYVCEGILNQAGMHAQVLNAGVSGYSSAEEFIFLENEGVKYKPAVVVLGFYANDFFDNVKDGYYVLEGDSMVNKSKRFQPGTALQDKIYSYGIVRFLSENSYLYNFVFNTIWNWKKYSLIKNKRNEQNKNQAGDDNTEEITTALQEPRDYECRLAAALVKRMYDVCRAHNIRFVIVDIPRDHPLRSSIPEKYVDIFKQNCDTLLLSSNYSAAYAGMKQTHVPHGTRHISAETHALIGEQVSNYIIQNFKKN